MCITPYLTEEHEHAHVLLQQECDAECPSLGAAQWVKQQLPSQSPLPLRGPQVYFLLAVGKRAVLPLLAFLALLDLFRETEEEQERGMR